MYLFIIHVLRLLKFRAHPINRGNKNEKGKCVVDTQIVTDPLALVDHPLDLRPVSGYSLEESQHTVQI